MSKFITKIKRIRTDELIYTLSNFSIEMFKNNMSCTATFPVDIIKYGICRQKANVTLTAWDIPSIEYFSAVESSDYRSGGSVNSLPEIIDLYRAFESSLAANQIDNSANNDIFKIVMGITSEQFQYQNLNLIFERLNRTYHILIAAKNYEHRNEIDTDIVFKNVFDFSPERLSYSAPYGILALYSTPCPIDSTGKPI